MNDETVPARLELAAIERPGAVAVRYLGGVAGTEVIERSYAELTTGARVAAGALRRLGVAAGERALLLLPSDLDMVEAFLGCLYAGVIAVPVPLPGSRRAEQALRRLEGVIADADPAVILTTRQISDQVRHPRRLVAIEELTGPPVRLHDGDGGDVAFLQYTSGSTGDPKGVRNTHVALLTQAALFAGARQWDEPIHFAGWLPLHHDMGAILGLLVPLLNGGTCTFMRPATFTADPRRWLETVSRYRANLTAAPDFAYERCCDAFTPAEAAQLDLRCLRSAINGAEPIRPATLDRFRTHFATAGLRPEAITPGYGLAEACLAVSVTGPGGYRVGHYDPTSLTDGVATPVEPGTGRALTSCGGYFHQWKVAIVDPDRGGELPERRLGEIWVTGPGLPDGYWRKPAETAAVFGSRLADGTGPYLRTGDLGFLDDGELFVCGRLKDLVIFQGTNHTPNDIEATLERSVPEVGVGRSCVVQDVTDAVIALVEVERDAAVADLADRIRRTVLSEHELPLDTVALLPRGALERTTSGKIRRARMAARFYAGSLPTLYISTRQGLGPITADGLRELVAELLECPAESFSDDDDLLCLGLSSAMMTGVAARLARRGVQVGFAELFRCPTLRAWTGLVERNAAAGPFETEHLDPAAPFDLTPLQHAYWIGRRSDQALGGVGCHAYLELDGCDIAPARLQAAMHAVLARHGMLRAAFHADGTQQILPSAPWPGLTVHDLRDAQPDDPRELLAHRVLDVTVGQVVDLALTLLPGSACRLHLNLDLLAADAWSLSVLLADLASAYQGAALQPLDYGFNDYLAAKRARRGWARDQARVYWHERLAELPEGPRLPLAIDPAEVVRPRFHRREHRLEPGARRALEDRARAHGLTISTVLATAFADVLAGWSADPRFCLNVTLFDRWPFDAAVPELVGDFTNVVLLAVDAAAGGSFLDRVRRVQERVRDDLAACDYSGVEVLRDLTRSHNGEPARAPAVFTSYLGRDLVPAAAREVFGELGWMLTQTPQVWLDHQVFEAAAGLVLSWDAVEELFPVGVLDAMFAAYTDLVAGLAGAADWASVGAPVLLPVAQRSVREKVNTTGGPLSEHRLHDRFFAHAAVQPDGLALLWGSAGELTYGALAQAALRMAGHLTGSGVRPGDAVAVCLPRGPQQVIAVLGVLASGATYVPVGVDQPAARRQRIHASAEVVAVLEEFPDLAGVEPLPDPVATGTDLPAYVIFTSGSTGEPKGVVVSHAAAANTVEDVCRRWDLDAADRVLAVSALDFDLSVFDIFGLLSVGGAVVMLEEVGRRDAQRWLALAEQHRVSVWNSVPVLFDMLLTTAEAAGGLPESLRLVLLSGDWVGLDLQPRLAALQPAARLVALGGATEAAVWSNWYDVAQLPAHATSVPYGRPLANQRYRVVDALGRDCPDHVPGELWIGGAGVAAGYRGDPTRTAERFVTAEGTRWYRTGDLGRYWPDGILEFLGRTDNQVKIRGHRIELGEIETALAGHPDIHRVVAVAVGNPRRLAAVVTPEGRNPDELRAWLADQLPGWMIPTSIVVAAQLPLSANGKVDRRAVERIFAVDRDLPSAAFEPPQSPVEQAVARIWAELLGVETIGRRDDFFSLGGDSLLGTRLVARLGCDGVEGATLNGLFATPTLADFTAPLKLGIAAPAVARLIADPEHRHDPFPLTEVQRAYWIGRSEHLPLGGVGTHYYTELEAPHVDLGRLETAWNRLVQRHDMLRAVIERGAQRVLERVPHYEITLTDGDPADLRTELSHQLFDPACWPLFELRAIRHGERTRLGVSLDYLVLDGMSIKILLAELAEFYTDPDAELAPLGMTFRDYVTGVAPDSAERAAAEVYWRARLPLLPPAPQLPLATDPARLRAPRFARRETVIDAGAWAAIKQQARERGLTPSALLLSCYTDVLSAWSARPDLTVHLTLFDRREAHPDIDRVLGDFTTLLLLAHQPEPGESREQAARRLQNQLARDLDHRAISSVWVLREMARVDDRPGAGPGAMPVVFTSTLGLDDGLFNRLPEGFPRPVFSLTQTPQVWLDHQVFEAAGGLVLSWDAVEELFPVGVLDAMFAAYTDLVGALAGSADWASVGAPVLLPVAQRVVREAVNATGGPLPAQRLHEGFFAAAVAEPDRPALLWGGSGGPVGELSYGGLAAAALRLGGYLAGVGVGPGDAVAVSLPRGPDQVIAVLGVLAAGGVYVPVGLDQPLTRRARMQSAAQVVLTLDQVTLDQIPGPAGVTGLPAPVAGPVDGAAYVIFTSGSTGEPKGVEVSHAAAVNTVADVCDRWGVGAQDRVLAVSALDFDLSVFDVFGLLSVGGAVVLVEEAARRDAQEWLGLAHRHRVSVWNSVPVLFDMLLTTAQAGDGLPDCLRLVLVSGDWVGLDLAPRLAQLQPGARLIALGGATEAGIWSNWYDVAELPAHAAAVPYGRPLANQCYRVVDALGRDCPDHVPGELWIGGAGVAAGYRGDPTCTGERFVEAEGTRWYRTGDLGRYWPDGILEFLGRTDNQVKIRGHRIELGEIETALAADPQVADAVAVAVGRPPRLAAALTPAVVPVPTHIPELEPTTGPEVDDEATATEALLLALLTEHLGLRLDGSPPPQVADHQREVLAIWLDWLTDRGVVTPAGCGHRPGHRFDAVPVADTARLDHLTDVLLPVLRGDRPPLTILDDPLLSPEAMVDARSETTALIAALVEDLTAKAKLSDRPLRVAEIGGRTGRIAVRLLAAIRPGSVSYTLLDPSSALLAAARDRLAGSPHEIEFARLPESHVPDELRHRFDVVLAVAALHRFADPSVGAFLAAQLLAPGGALLALEPALLPPSALLSVLPAERGFVDLDPARRRNRSPLLEPAEWAELFGRAGLATARAELHGTTALLQADLPRSAAVLDLEGVRARLGDRLPAAMVPDRFLVLPRLPLSANGKVDRAAIRRLADGLVVGRGGRAGDPPHGPVEEAVGRVWADLLGVTAVSRHDDFFALGGDSLLATRMVARLEAAGVSGVELARLFAAPRLADFAATLVLDPAAASAAATGLRLDPARRHEPFPLTDVQQAYWIGRSADLPLGGVGSHCYFEFDGEDVDADRLTEAWNRLIARHDMLRAVITEDGTQRVLPEVPRLEIPTLTIPDGRPHEAALAELRAAMSHQLIKLDRWPLFDIRALRYGRRTRIGISLDNILLDGLSMMIVLTELARLYTDPGAQLAPLGMTFRDYVTGLTRDPADTARAEAHWRERLAQLPQAPMLPLAADPATVVRPRFTRRAARLPAEQWGLIKKLAREHGLTPSAVLLAGYAEILSAFSEQPDVCVNLTLFDRAEVHPDIDRVVGDFTSLLLVPYSPAPRWLSAVRGLQDRLARDLTHRQVSAIWVLRELARTRAVRGEAAVTAAMPVVFTSALGLDRALPGWNTTAFPAQVWGLSQTPQVLLDHQVHEVDGELVYNWDAVEALFPAGLLDEMFAAYGRLLEWAAGSDWDAPAPLPSARAAFRGTSAVPQPGPLRPLAPPPDEPPCGAAESALAALWAELLGIDPPGRRQNFFALGGDSLLATRMAAAVRQRYGVELSMRLIFDTPTIAALAPSIQAAVGPIAEEFLEGAL